MDRTVTKTGMQSKKIEQAIAHFSGSGSGISKWLHFTYDIGRKRLEYRLHWMRKDEGERVSHFDSLDEAIEAYNEI